VFGDRLIPELYHNTPPKYISLFSSTIFIKKRLAEQKIIPTAFLYYLFGLTQLINDVAPLFLILNQKELFTQIFLYRHLLFD